MIHYRTVENRHTCYKKRLPCCQISVWFQFIQETKNMTRSQLTFFIFALVCEVRLPELSIVADRKAAIKFKSLNFSYDSTIVSWDLLEQHILVDQRLVLNRKYRQLGKQCWIDIIKMIRFNESLDRLFNYIFYKN